MNIKPNELVFITLRHPAMHTAGRTQCEHQSSLSIGGNGVERDAQHEPLARNCMRVVGNLEHNAYVMPATREDRDELVRHLRSIRYPRRKVAQ
jgi:hypothetical protein